jgi:DNA replication protein DnaC
MRMQNQWLAEAMHKPVAERRVSNPFATRWVKPGAVRYCFPADVNTQTLIEKLKDRHWRGAIVGPHGSGKSTLLCELISAIEQLGIDIRRISLCDGQRKLSPGFLQQVRRDMATGSASDADVDCLPKSLLVIDGYEQLGWWARTPLRIVDHRARR